MKKYLLVLVYLWVQPFLSAYYIQSQNTYINEFFSYWSKNYDCPCYWPKDSPLSSDIRKSFKKRINEIILESSIYDNLNMLDDLLIEKFTRHSPSTEFTKHLFTCFLYSQYHDASLALIDWISMANYSATDTISITNSIFDTLEAIQDPFITLYTECISKHAHPKIYYERGMLHHHMGNYSDSLSDIRIFLDSCPKKELTSDLYFKEGSAYNETGIYDKAILSLTQAIEQDPENQDAYFERAYAYFETGEFDKSIDDFLMSNEEYEISIDNSEFGKSLVQGIIRGGLQGGKEFIPSTLYSAYGIGQGLWALASDRVEASTAFAKAAANCIRFLKETTGEEKLKLLVPEAQTLYANWDGLSPEDRGEATGFLIGKYGIEVFMGKAAVKGFTYFKSLKKANAALTFSAMEKSSANKKVIKAAAKARKKNRVEVLKNNCLKIEADKQGKHIPGHRNFDKNKSPFLHTNPEKLAENYAGKGIPDSPATPGIGGYREIVNFEEFIGYSMDRISKEKIPTTWGKIHYSKKGIHIVPCKPQDFL
jgi:tetratricopeptide (TPR) repeat protein